MSDAAVLYSLADDVATIRLNRPDELNAVTMDMLDLLAATFQRAADEGARAILFTGEGRGFCAGASLKAAGRGGDPGEHLRYHYNPLVEVMAQLSIPIVTALNGPAAGAGVGLALSGDIVIAARSAYLLLAFANIGLVPDAGATWLVAKGAGRAKALEMALLGERMSAQDAHSAGLVNHVVDDGAVFDTAMGYARKLAQMPTVALGLIRQQVRAALTATLSETLSLEAVNQRTAGRTQDFQEGVRAFVEKRRPEFKGE